MIKKFLCLSLLVAFTGTTVIPTRQAAAQPLLGLPEPGNMVSLSPAYQPAMIKGLTVHKDNPFQFDFIVDQGQDKLAAEDFKKEGEKLIKYFMASLAVPEKDLWVNLSPYEKDRTIPEALSQTEMGRDLLAQDYILKQITASLIYPEQQVGKAFWDKIYSQTRQMYGAAAPATAELPVQTFNKVWIMADRAEIFERGQTVFVVDSHLKVMLEEDYLALALNTNKKSATSPKGTTTAQIVRDIILPEIEKEVNTGKNFANLRQIVNSLILANWYKKNLKEAVLNQVYTGQNKVKGIDLQDKSIKNQIYERYLQAYKKGVFNFIKEDPSTSSGQASMPRKYFSGGMLLGGPAIREPARAMLADVLKKFVPGLVNVMVVGALLVGSPVLGQTRGIGKSDPAMANPAAKPRGRPRTNPVHSTDALIERMTEGTAYKLPHWRDANQSSRLLEVELARLDKLKPKEGAADKILLKYGGDTYAATKQQVHTLFKNLQGKPVRHLGDFLSRQILTAEKPDEKASVSLENPDLGFSTEFSRRVAMEMFDKVRRVWEAGGDGRAFLERLVQLLFENYDPGTKGIRHMKFGDIERNSKANGGNRQIYSLLKYFDGKLLDNGKVTPAFVQILLTSFAEDRYTKKPYLKDPGKDGSGRRYSEEGILNRAMNSKPFVELQELQRFAAKHLVYDDQALGPVGPSLITRRLRLDVHATGLIELGLYDGSLIAPEKALTLGYGNSKAFFYAGSKRILIPSLKQAYPNDQQNAGLPVPLTLHFSILDRNGGRGFSFTDLPWEVFVNQVVEGNERDRKFFEREWRRNGYLDNVMVAEQITEKDKLGKSKPVTKMRIVLASSQEFVINLPKLLQNVALWDETKGNVASHALAVRSVPVALGEVLQILRARRSQVKNPGFQLSVTDRTVSLKPINENSERIIHEAEPSLLSAGFQVAFDTRFDKIVISVASPAMTAVEITQRLRKVMADIARKGSRIQVAFGEPVVSNFGKEYGVTGVVSGSTELNLITAYAQELSSQTGSDFEIETGKVILIKLRFQSKPLEVQPATSYQRAVTPTDFGMDSPSEPRRGGIDLDPAKTVIKTGKEGAGVRMDVDAAMIARIRRDGLESLSPQIVSITALPERGVRSLVGLGP